MSETFKVIPGFPKYEVSDPGNVRSLQFRKPKLLGGGRDNKGYRCLTLCREGEHKSVRVHRLVAEAFVDNPLDLSCVRHLDGNPANDRASNLCWGTYAENEQDKRDHGTYHLRSSGAPLFDETIRQKICSLRESGMSQRQLANLFGVSRPTITRLLNGSTWRTQ